MLYWALLTYGVVATLAPRWLRLLFLLLHLSLLPLTPLLVCLYLVVRLFASIDMLAHVATPTDMASSDEEGSSRTVRSSSRLPPPSEGASNDYQHQPQRISLKRKAYDQLEQDVASKKYLPTVLHNATDETH
jgi:hypothetical protein